MSSRRPVWPMVYFSVPILMGGVLWMAGGLFSPPETEPRIRVGDWGEAAPKPPERLRVLSYNIHFGIGCDDDHTKVDEAAVRRVLDGMTRLIRSLNPDVVLLQEVDFDSARSFGIDQMEALAKGTGLRYMAPVTTWKKRYIPFPYWPPTAHYGRMHSGQAVLSRFPIEANRAVRLPQPAANPFWYNVFYLTRTFQEVDLSVGGETVRVCNVHTEAFDLENRSEHADILIAHLTARALPLTILAGDFNAVPPEATVRHAFADEPETDMRGDTSIARLRERLGLGEILPPERYRADESAALTFPANAPNRRLDYLFYSSAFRLLEGRIVHEAGLLSDHLPAFAELAMGE